MRRIVRGAIEGKRALAVGRNHGAEEGVFFAAGIKVLLNRRQLVWFLGSNARRRIDVGLKSESQRPRRHVAQLSRSQPLRLRIAAARQRAQQHNQ